MVEVALIFAVFFAFGAWPAPDSNETSYLARAKHQWDPQWCSGDFFLEGGAAHRTFYTTFGWLMVVLPLPAAAWCGRILVWLLLAGAWRCMAAALNLPGGYAVLAAALFLLFRNCCGMAGGWVIGGFEAKGVAWALVWLALSCLMRGRWNIGLMLLGCATAFHVLVGGWSLVAAALAWLMAPGERPSLVSILPGGVAAVLLSLPGLAPSLSAAVLSNRETAAEALRIYVFERNTHHLLPDYFPAVRVALFLALLLLWWFIARQTPGDDRAAMTLRRFVNGAILIGAAGALIRLLTWHDEALSASLLRYYWFRLPDAVVPLGAALLGTLAIAHAQALRVSSSRLLLIGAIAAASVHLGAIVIWREFHPRPRSDQSVAALEDWREACEWIAANTPKDAVFLTPRLQQSFHWYAQRGEVVSYKDVPPSADQIIQWWRRLRDVHGADAPVGETQWRDSLALQDAAKLRELGRRYGATYVVTDAQPRLDLPRVDDLRGRYVVYRLDRAVDRSNSD